MLRYARATQPGAELALGGLEVLRRADTLVIDEQARAHLELVESLQERRRAGSLIDLLDRTRTAMGGRLLRRWLLFPSRDLATIRRRQDAVERLVAGHAARDKARKRLGEIADLERLVARARLGVATPRDLAVLGRSLGELPALAAELDEAHRGEIGAPAGGEADWLALGEDLATDLASELTRILRPDAPALTKDGGYVNAGVSAELDELRDIAAGGRDRIAAIEIRERERTGIPSLKVKLNSVFGYYIEVTRSNLAAVPADYRRKQTVANAERFVTPELAEFEATVLTADERRIALELELFTKLRARVAADAERLLALAGRVAAADALAALAEVAHRNGYCRPEVDDSGVIELCDSRHPVVEQLAAAGSFVPNDVRLDPAAEQLLIVSGPNMAGKSTLMRQVALAVIQAQMGGFVAARTARIGLCDRVFTRVGAGDNLARGESTFMVEMRETAQILRHATAQSLIVLDEIGAARRPTTACRLPGRWPSTFTTTWAPRRSSRPTTTSWRRWPPIGRACATSASPPANGRARWSFCASWCRAAPTAPSAWRSPSWPDCPQRWWRARAPSCARSRPSRRRAVGPVRPSWVCGALRRRRRRHAGPGRAAGRDRRRAACRRSRRFVPRAAHQLLVELKRKLTPSP